MHFKLNWDIFLQSRYRVFNMSGGMLILLSDVYLSYVNPGNLDTVTCVTHISLFACGCSCTKWSVFRQIETAYQEVLNTQSDSNEFLGHHIFSLTPGFIFQFYRYTVHHDINGNSWLHNNIPLEMGIIPLPLMCLVSYDTLNIYIQFLL